MGDARHTVDLLASKFNKLDRFDARTRDSQTFAVDSLVTLWDQFNLIFDYSPIKCLTCLLHRIQ